MNAEGFVLKVAEEELSVSQTFYIKDNKLYFKDINGIDKELITFIKSQKLEEKINNNDDDIIQFFNKDINLNYKELSNKVCPYFLFNILDNNIRLLINIENSKVEDFYFCQVFSLFSFLKNICKDKNVLLNKINNFLENETDIYKFPSCPEKDKIQTFLKDLINKCISL